ncbi:hypothetical protein MRX96_013111 [Rhipicephalus microplus]
MKGFWKRLKQHRHCPLRPCKDRFRRRPTQAHGSDVLHESLEGVTRCSHGSLIPSATATNLISDSCSGAHDDRVFAWGYQEHERHVFRETWGSPARTTR